MGVHGGVTREEGSSDAATCKAASVGGVQDPDVGGGATKAVTVHFTPPGTDCFKGIWGSALVFPSSPALHTSRVVSCLGSDLTCSQLACDSFPGFCH